MSNYLIAPCKSCGVDIEDEAGEPPSAGADWYCTSCWPRIYRRRLEQQLADTTNELERIRQLYDNETAALNMALRQSVERERRLEQAVKESRAVDVDGLVERGRYVARLETALRLVIEGDFTDDYYQRMKSDGLIQDKPSWGSPKTIALAALQVRKKPPKA